MSKNKNMIPLKELNLTSRFLFDEVMEDPQAQQDMLSIIFGREIPVLQQNETEKEFRLSPLIRYVRMDIFSVDEEENIYNTEMQDKKRNDLVKRSRYYQSLMDTSLLEPGIPNYNHLNQTYLIMIMTFDLFGYGKYRYTFAPRCEEVPECTLEDGAVRIFLNTRGENREEVSEELIHLLLNADTAIDKPCIFSPRRRYSRFPCTDKPAVLLMYDHNPFILLSVILTHSRGTVRRPVIDQDQLKIPVCLCKNAVYTSA